MIGKMQLEMFVCRNAYYSPLFNVVSSFSTLRGGIPVNNVLSTRFCTFVINLQFWWKYQHSSSFSSEILLFHVVSSFLTLRGGIPMNNVLSTRFCTFVMKICNFDENISILAVFPQRFSSVSCSFIIFNTQKRNSHE